MRHSQGCNIKGRERERRALDLLDLQSGNLQALGVHLIPVSSSVCDIAVDTTVRRTSFGEALLAGVFRGRGGTRKEKEEQSSRKGIKEHLDDCGPEHLTYPILKPPPLHFHRSHTQFIVKFVPQCNGDTSPAACSYPNFMSFLSSLPPLPLRPPPSSSSSSNS